MAEKKSWDRIHDAAFGTIFCISTASIFSFKRQPKKLKNICACIELILGDLKQKYSSHDPLPLISCPCLVLRVGWRVLLESGSGMQRRREEKSWW
jgi:hypothetical protein